jgi:hypothetical protein
VLVAAVAALVELVGTVTVTLPMVVGLVAQQTQMVAVAGAVAQVEHHLLSLLTLYVPHHREMVLRTLDEVAVDLMTLHKTQTPPQVQVVQVMFHLNIGDRNGTLCRIR